MLYQKNNDEDNSKNIFRKFEIKIFDLIQKNDQFKEICHPVVILEKINNNIKLGCSEEAYNRVNNSFFKKKELEHIIHDIFDDPAIKIELKIAKNEVVSLSNYIKNKLIKEKKEQSIIEAIKSQKDEGKCNIIPFPKHENKVRSELTMERHTLFASNTFKGDFRTFEK